MHLPPALFSKPLHAAARLRLSLSLTHSLTHSHSHSHSHSPLSLPFDVSSSPLCLSHRACSDRLGQKKSHLDLPRSPSKPRSSLLREPLLSGNRFVLITCSTPLSDLFPSPQSCLTKAHCALSSPLHRRLEAYFY